MASESEPGPSTSSYSSSSSNNNSENGERRIPDLDSHLRTIILGLQGAAAGSGEKVPWTLPPKTKAQLVTSAEEHLNTFPEPKRKQKDVNVKECWTPETTNTPLPPSCPPIERERVSSVLKRAAPHSTISILNWPQRHVPWWNVPPTPSDSKPILDEGEGGHGRESCFPTRRTVNIFLMGLLTGILLMSFLSAVMDMGLEKRIKPSPAELEGNQSKWAGNVRQNDSNSSGDNSTSKDEERGTRKGRSFKVSTLAPPKQVTIPPINSIQSGSMDKGQGSNGEKMPKTTTTLSPAPTAHSENHEPSPNKLVDNMDPPTSREALTPTTDTPSAAEKSQNYISTILTTQTNYDTTFTRESGESNFPDVTPQQPPNETSSLSPNEESEPSDNGNPTNLPTDDKVHEEENFLTSEISQATESQLDVTSNYLKELGATEGFSSSVVTGFISQNEFYTSHYSESVDTTTSQNVYEREGFTTESQIDINSKPSPQDSTESTKENSNEPESHVEHEDSTEPNDTSTTIPETHKGGQDTESHGASTSNFGNNSATESQIENEATTKLNDASITESQTVKSVTEEPLHFVTESHIEFTNESAGVNNVTTVSQDEHLKVTTESSVEHKDSQSPITTESHLLHDATTKSKIGNIDETETQDTDSESHYSTETQSGHDQHIQAEFTNKHEFSTESGYEITKYASKAPLTTEIEFEFVETSTISSYKESKEKVHEENQKPSDSNEERIEEEEASNVAYSKKKKRKGFWDRLWQKVKEVVNKVIRSGNP